MTVANCNFCNTPLVTKKKCAQCKIVFYCSRDCQVKDWKCGHKQECNAAAEQLQPLYPGPPGWIQHPSEFVKHLNTLGFEMPNMPFLYANFINQREMDERWRYLSFLSENSTKDPIPFAEMVLRYEKAGFDLRSVQPNNVDRKKWTFKDLVDSGIHMPAFMPESERVPLEEINKLYQKTCDHCRTPCVQECICGEAYCSRECQEKDHESHKKACALVRDNNEISMTLTRLWWDKKIQGSFSPKSAKSKIDR